MSLTRETSGRWAACSALLPANSKMGDQIAIPLDVSVHDVIEQTATLADQHQESTTAVMVLLVDLQVFGEVSNASGKQRNLHLRRTSICLLYTSPSPRDGLLSRMPSSA